MNLSPFMADGVWARPSSSNNIYNSLFRNPEPYTKIIETLAKSKSGLSRNEIATETNLPMVLTPSPKKKIWQCATA